MNESQISRVEEVAAGISILQHKLPILAFTVDVVPDNRMANRTEMHTNLVRAAGLDPDFEQ